MKRRDFVKTVALSGMAVAASDLVGDLIAQTPQGKVLESKFKGLSDIALLEAKTQGCTYADIRFTRNTNSGVNATGGNRDFDDFGGGFGGRGGGRGGRGRRTGRRRGLRRRRRRGTERRRGLRRARHPQRRLGLREQPDRHRGRDSAHHAHGYRSGQGERDRQAHGRQAGARAGVHRVLVERLQEGPAHGPAGREAGLRPEGRRRGRQDEGSHQRQRLGAARARVEVLRELGRVLHRAGDFHDHAVVYRDGAEGRPDAVADVQRRGDDRRLGSRRSVEDARERRTYRGRGGRVLHRQAGRDGRQGSHPDPVARDADHPRDRRPRDRARSHPRLRGQLRRHELHQAVRRRQVEVRLEALQRHRRSQQAWRQSGRRATTTTA